LRLLNLKYQKANSTLHQPLHHSLHVKTYLLTPMKSLLKLNLRHHFLLQVNQQSKG